MRKAVMLAAAGFCSLVIAGCSMNSSSSSTGGNPSPGSSAGSSSMTVGVRTVSGVGQVLVNSKGRTLYLADQEKSGKILCAKADCTAIWAPVTMIGGMKPSGPSNVSSKLATVKRPDGKTQVTLNGAPLYTFAEDQGAGDARGNGQNDSFDGTSFNWHAATPTEAATGQSSSSGSGGGYGGY